MVAFKFEHQDFEIEKPHPGTELGDLRFRQRLTQTQWYALPLAVRQRFGRRVKGGQSKIYQGRITHNKMSRLGFYLAQILRFIGAPLPIEKHGIGAPAIVTVTEDKHGNGQFWTRQYGRAKRFPQVIHSAKRFAGPTGLEEHIGFGIGMTLILDVVCGNLLFKQNRYFWEVMGRRAYIPNWMTPGDLIISHEDCGQDANGRGQFNFHLILKHRLLGELIHQTVLFKDVKET